MALSSGITPEYVNSLVHATMQVSTSHIVTEKDINTGFFSFRSNFLHHLSLINPDIVHIHGAWNFRTAWVAELARKKGYFVVISPHGELSPTKMEQRFWRDRFPKILLYQLRMIRNSNMLVATTREEFEDMKKLNWKSNISLIPHPIINGLSNDEVSDLLLSAYRKVIDTNYRERLTSEEDIFFNACLKAAIWPDDMELPYDVSEASTIGISFRRLYLLAYDDKATDLFVKGAKRIGVSIPPQLDVDAIPRFKHRIKYNKHEARLFRRFSETLNTLIPESMQIETKDMKRVTLPDLTYVYRAIRLNNFDEDDFIKAISRKHLKRYTRRLLALLQETFQLEEGYMPIKI